jgi:hypothetical protein
VVGRKTQRGARSAKPDAQLDQIYDLIIDADGPTNPPPASVEEVRRVMPIEHMIHPDTGQPLRPADIKGLRPVERLRIITDPFLSENLLGSRPRVRTS